MKSPARLLLLAATTAALGLSVAALVAQPGCTSNCNTICAATYVYIGSPDGMTQVPITGIYLGPSPCPPRYGVTCIGTQSTGGCTHFTITGQAEGVCDVGLTFSDRPAEIVHLEFGPIRSCCSGYPVIGESNFYIPADPTAPIYGAGGGSQDAVTILLDASSDGEDAASDGGTTDDGATPDTTTPDGATDDGAPDGAPDGATDDGASD